MNVCIFSGRLAENPDYRKVNGGKSVATMRIIVNRFVKGEQRSQGVKLVLWENLADVAERFCIKGKTVTVQARFASRSYEKNGETRYTNEFVVTELELGADPKGENGHGSNGQSEGMRYSAAHGDEVDDELADSIPF